MSGPRASEHDTRGTQKEGREINCDYLFILRSCIRRITFCGSTESFTRKSQMSTNITNTMSIDDIKKWFSMLPALIAIIGVSISCCYNCYKTRRRDAKLEQHDEKFESNRDLLWSALDTWRPGRRAQQKMLWFDKEMLAQLEWRVNDNEYRANNPPPATGRIERSIHGPKPAVARSAGYVEIDPDYKYVSVDGQVVLVYKDESDE